MKNLIQIGAILLITGMFFACSTGADGEAEIEEVVELIDLSGYENFGGAVEFDKLLSIADMQMLYNELESGDSATVTFQSTVNTVCQKKGCWMQLDLEDDQVSFVQFRDYEFFVPMDAEGADAIVKGTAYKEEISVEELRHYAEDAGKSEEEIAEITEPKIELTFMADGVLLKKHEEAIQ